MLFSIRSIQNNQEKNVDSVSVINQTKEGLRGETLTVKCRFPTFSRLLIN